MSTRRFTLCALCFSFTLSACASIYTPRLSSDAASVRFVVEQNDRFGPDPFFMVAALSDEKCGTDSPAGRITAFTTHARSASQHQSLNMLGGNDISLADKHEIRIPAGERLAIVFNGTFSVYPISSECAAAVSFDPQAGEQYEAEYRSQRDSCTVVVTRLQQSSEGKVVRSPETSVRYLSCRYPGNF